MSENKKILLVDDDEQIREILINRLSKRDFDIKEAEDGQMALDILKSFHPDLILLDIEMPKMNGHVTCEQIRKNKSQKKIPIIFLTGNKEDWDMVTAYSGGGDVYLIKPMIIDKDFIEKLTGEMNKLLS